MNGTGLSKNYSLDKSNLTPDCLDHLRKFLWTDSIELTDAKQVPLDGQVPQLLIYSGHGSLLDTACQIEAWSLVEKDQSLLLVCAKPENSPSFGQCFPMMPGGETLPGHITSENPDPGTSAIATPGFYLSQISLQKPLWVFLYSSLLNGSTRSPISSEPSTLQSQFSRLEKYVKVTWWSEWSVLAGISFQTFVKEARNGLYMWGHMPVIPELRDFTDFLEWTDFSEALFKATILYPDAFPVLSLNVPLTSKEYKFASSKLTQPQVELTSPLYYSPGTSHVILRAGLGLQLEDKTHEIEFEVDFPLTGDLIVASGTYTGETIPFIDASAITDLPNLQPKDRTEFEIILQFSKSTKKLKRVGFTVVLENWPLIEGLLTLESIAFSFNVYDPLDSKMVTASIAARACLGKQNPIELFCGGHYPGGQLFFRLASSTELTIGNLIGELGGRSEGLQDDLTISYLTAEYNLYSKHFSTSAGVSGTWKILDGFVLKNLRFQLQRVQTLYVEIGALISISGVEVRLEANYDDGWQFAGSTGPGQEIHIGDLIKELGRLFGNEPQLPAPLQDLVIKDLGVSFNTKNKDFRFTCESDLPVSAQSSLAIKLFIDVTHDDKGTFQFTFSGKFDVRLEDKTLEFELKIEHAAKTDRLVAAYHHDGKLPLNVSALVCALVPGDSELTGLIMGMDIAVDLKEIQIAFYKEAPESAQASKSLFGMLLCAEVSFSDPFSTDKVITVELNSLLFSSFARETANQNGGPKATSKFLFGLKIGVELSLSDMPLVGAQLPAGQAIGVKDLQLFAASQAILPGDLEQVKNLLPSDKLPTPKAEDPAQPAKKLEVGVTVDAILMLGAESRNLVFAPSGESQPGQEMQGRPGDQVIASSPGTEILPARSAPEEKGLALSEKAIQPAEPAVKWIKIQKSFGPVRFDRLGFKYQNQVLWFLLDASLSAAGLMISLEGFGFGSSITKFEPRFELQGLGIDFKNDPFEISGAFLKTGANQYSGQALIKAESFMLSAIGQYANVEGIGTSLFIFAYIDMPLGGPPCFYVTGLAAGFGYNSSVRTPTIEQVKDFPLLAAMVDPSKIGGKDANPMQVLETLHDWVEPQPGAYWLALGISFKSFEIIKSDVLAIVEFGQEFQLLVVGFSTIKLPQEGKDRIYVYAELMIQIIIKPAEGVIAAMAQLTSNSYLLDPNCHLTGGFAFYMWFGENQHAGDFVLTIGGYHPSFIVPDHYPQVPRLGFNWPVSKNVTIKGEAYFALTPSCVMAGGKLEVLYHSGRLKAWFIACADMIVYWKPFYFVARVSVRIGVSYRTIFGTLKIELGASVELWGPPTGGKARITCWFISFTVSFGAGKRTSPLTMDWQGFKTMLPQRKNGVQALPMSSGPDLGVIQININNGLLQQVDGENGKKRWIVHPNEFAFSIETAVPLTEALLVKSEGEVPVLKSDGQIIPNNNAWLSKQVDGENGNKRWFVSPKAENTATAQETPPTFGIRPMGIREIDSPLTISICQGDQCEPLSLTEWDCEPLIRNLPEAMWGLPVNGSPKAKARVINCLAGVKNIQHEPPVLTGPDKFPLEKAFSYSRISEPDANYLPLSPAASEPVSGFPTTDDTLQTIQNTLMDGEVRDRRKSIFDELGKLGMGALTNGDLSTLASNPAANYEAAPMRGTLVP